MIQGNGQGTSLLPVLRRRRATLSSVQFNTANRGALIVPRGLFKTLASIHKLSRTHSFSSDAIRYDGQSADTATGLSTFYC